MNAQERGNAYQDLSRAASGANSTLAGYLEPMLETARYRLGGSVADFALPYTLGDDLRTAFTRALRELAFFVVRRQF